MTFALLGAAVAAYLSVEYLTGQAGLCLTGSGCDQLREVSSSAGWLAES